ncbi:hypothetical protein C8R46DRAFT_642914 [Mycena filopes]|nr:hypothetical protein C8R46DRAFT_642914 [Mycena filopes]
MPLTYFPWFPCPFGYEPTFSRGPTIPSVYQHLNLITPDFPTRFSGWQAGDSVKPERTLDQSVDSIFLGDVNCQFSARWFLKPNTTSLSGTGRGREAGRHSSPTVGTGTTSSPSVQEPYGCTRLVGVDAKRNLFLSHRAATRDSLLILLPPGGERDLDAGYGLTSSECIVNRHSRQPDENTIRHVAASALLDLQRVHAKLTVNAIVLFFVFALPRCSRGAC